MREFLLVIAVIVVLIGLTAIKYRKQIKGMFEMWRALKEIGRGGIGDREKGHEKIRSGGKLVNCSKCGAWIPESTGIRLGKTTIVCADGCNAGA